MALEKGALTAIWEKAPLELVLRNSLVREGCPSSASARIKNVYNLRLTPFCSLWIFNCTLQPKFLLSSYFFLAALRLHNTMITINLYSVEFY